MLGERPILRRKKRAASVALWLFVCWQAVLWIGHAHAVELRGGWSLQLPYQYETNALPGPPSLTGFDIEVMRAVAKKVGDRVVFDEVTWAETLRAVREGELDFALAATPEESRFGWAWFSLPYRKESIALITRKGESRRWRAANPAATLHRLLESGGKVAVTQGAYYGPEAMGLLENRAGQILTMENEEAAFASLLAGEADGFLADRLTAASIASQAGSLSSIEAVPGLLYEADLCFMFSKKTVSEGTLLAFNSALENLRDSGRLAQISRHYLVPHLLMLTKEALWFWAFDGIGTVAFALSGVIIARREHYDLVGACVLAALPALGGGVMRDLLSGRAPLTLIAVPSFSFLVLGTVLAGFLFFTLRDLMRSGEPPPPEKKFRWASMRGILEISDAIGLSTFTVVGVMVALEQRCEPLWLWGPVLAVLTAAGGGVLRDVLRAQADISTLKGSIYPEIAIVWGFVYSFFLMQKGLEMNLKSTLLLTLSVMGAAFLTRILVVRFQIRSLFLGRAPKR
jgi:polar amino acid transport system substrate-binding protein